MGGVLPKATPLVPGGAVGSPGPSVGSGAPFGPPTLSFDTSNVFGTYLSQITAGGVSWDLAPAYLCTITTWADPDLDGAGETTARDPTETTQSTDESTGIVTLTFTFATHTITATLTPKYSGYTYTLSSNTNASHALERIIFPRIRPIHDGALDSYAIGALFSGYVYNNPHMLTTAQEPALVNGAQYGNVIETPFAGFYQNGRCIATWFHDATGYSRYHGFVGDGSYCTFYHVHICPNARAYSNAFSLTYESHIELFQSPVTDGTAFYDIAKRWKDWSIQKSAAWVTSPWYANASVSARVKSLWWHILSGFDEASPTLNTTSVTRLNSFMSLSGSHRGLMRMYNWSSTDLSAVDDNPDPGTVDAAYNGNVYAAAGSVQAQNWHVYPYTLMTSWDTTLLAGSYAYDAFDAGAGAEAMEQYVCKDQAGVAVTDDTFVDEAPYALLDFGNFTAKCREIVSTILARYYALTTDKPRGWYLDTFPGTGVVHSYDLGITPPRGNNGLFLEGAKSIAARAKSDRTGSDSAFFTVSEAANPHLNGTVDIQCISDYAPIMCTAWLTQFAMSRYQRYMSLGTGNLPWVLDTPAWISAQITVSDWLHTGFLSFAIPGFGDPTVMSAAQAADPDTAIDVFGTAIANYYAMKILKGVSDLMPNVIDFFRGRLMRPLAGSWWDGYLAQTTADRGMVTYVTSAIHRGKLWESAWMSEANELGFMFVNANAPTNSMDSRFTPFEVLNLNETIEREFTFDPLLYEMPAHTGKTAYLVTSAGTTTLGTFTDTFTYTVSLAPSTAACVKIVQT